MINSVALINRRKMVYWRNEKSGVSIDFGSGAIKVLHQCDQNFEWRVNHEATRHARGTRLTGEQFRLNIS